MALLTGSYFLDLAILTTSVFFAIYHLYQKSFKHWEKYKIKHSQPKFPFGDLGLSLQENRTITVDRYYRSFPEEKVVGLWSFFQPLLIIRDVDIVKDILVKEFMSFHDRGFYVNEKDDPLSGNYLEKIHLEQKINYFLFSQFVHNGWAEMEEFTSKTYPDVYVRQNEEHVPYSC